MDSDSDTLPLHERYMTMETKMLTLREQLMTEIHHIPDDRLQEIFNLIHFFRLGLQSESFKPVDINKFAGAWSDMPETQFADYEAEWQERRHQAFKHRGYR